MIIIIKAANNLRISFLRSPVGNPQIISHKNKRVKNPLHFTETGDIVHLIFSDEGKHAVRRAVHRERGKVQARSGA
jgi:hypothetical protein